MYQLKAFYSWFGVDELFTKYKNYELVFTKYTTRDWNIEKKTSFFESIFLELPLPALYLFEESDILRVLDGNRRLQTIFSYLENQYQLDASTFYPACSYSYFSDLAHRDQITLQKTILTCIVIDNSSSKDVVNTLHARLQW